MTLVEKMCDAYGDKELDERDRYCCDWLSRSSLRQCMEAALQVVLDALREPSEEMAKTTMNAFDDCCPDTPTGYSEACHVLRAIADHLAKE